MIVSYKYQKNEKENKLVYTTVNEHGVETVKIIPIRDEKGNLTPEFIKETQKKKFAEYYAIVSAKKAEKVEEAKVEESKTEETVEESVEEVQATEETVEEAVEPEAISIEEAEVVEPELVEAEIIEDESTELMVPETKLAVIDYEEAPVELKKKKKFSWKKFLCLVGLLGLGAFAISRFEGCGKEDNKAVHTVTTPTPEPTKAPEKEQVSPTPTPVVIPTVEEQLEDSRYTEITEEAFEETVFNLQNELTAHGINLNGEDVVKFVTLANITHMQETNPELLSKIMGEDTDPQQFITKAAQVIGQVVYLEVTDKNEQVDWTIALMDKTDKEIADGYVKVFNDAKAYAEGEPIIEGGTYATREEKRIYIETLVAKEIIAKDFDNTTDVQEIGADFVTDAIITGCLLSDNEVKQFISTQEVIDELTIISSNKDVVSNLHTLIETVGCKDCNKVLIKQ